MKALVAFPMMVLMTFAAASAHAQWLKYRTPGVPRLPDGKPNLAEAAPRTADRKPDLSGIWQLEPAPCNPDAIAPCGGDYRGGRGFGNLGVRLPGGLPDLPWAAAAVKARSADPGKDDPVA